MKTTRFVIIVSSIFLANVTAFAASSLEFLKITPGPRPTAMGEAFTALADDANAVSFNPAGLAFNRAGEVHLSYSLWLGDSYYGFGAWQMPTKRGTFALSTNYLGGPAMPRIVNGRYSAAETFAPSDLSVGISYGVKLTNTLALGLGAHSVQETLDTNYAGSALTGDLGFLYRSNNGIFSVGYAVMNAGTEIKYTGTTTGEKVPMIHRAGVAFRLDLPAQYSDINVAADVSKPETGPMVYSVGLEHIGAKVLALRLGYKYLADPRQSKELGAGASLRAGVGIMIKGVGIDYAFQPMSALGDAHRAALVMKFGGKTIKEVRAGLKIDPEIFSPNGDGIKDGTFFLPEITEKIDKIKSWKISVTDSNSRVVKNLGAMEEIIPKIVTWDGKDDTGNYITEGRYFVEFSAEASDKMIRAKKTMLTADMTKPAGELAASATIFTPVAEGLAGETTFSYKMEDVNGLDRWQIAVYSPKNTVVKRFKSDEYVSIGSPTVSGEVAWSGRDEVNDWVVPNGQYNVVLTVYDAAGNKITDAVGVTVNVPAKVEVKEVVQEERGLKVSLSSEVLFAAGKSGLKTAAYPRLDQVVELLNAYPENNVIIEGHTDTAENREMSIQLSSERAWKVYSYLVKKGIKESRLQVKGWGFEKPIAKNTTKKGRAKNRRVEIIILKK